MKNDSYLPREYSVAECAYLAGIMDGEGCFYIGNYSHNKKTGTPHYQTTIKVSNCDEVLIKWLSDTFGGVYSKYTPNQTPKNARKPVYLWGTSGKRLEHLCEIMMPYLVIKKNQAEIMLTMRKTFKETGVHEGKYGNRLVTEEILILRKNCFDALKKIHQRDYINP